MGPSKTPRDFDSFGEVLFFLICSRKLANEWAWDICHSMRKPHQTAPGPVTLDPQPLLLLPHQHPNHRAVDNFGEQVGRE